jgi:hypothetical protein
MQTFCTSTDHNKTAQSLDNKRLFKQLLEGYQLLRASIVGPGFSRHPAKLMWEGYEHEFILYLLAMDEECRARGINSEDLADKIADFFRAHYLGGHIGRPLWLTDPVLADRVITTHRANLYLKDPIYYADWAGDVEHYERAICCDPRNRPKNSPCRYYWPTHDKEYNV